MDRLGEIRERVKAARPGPWVRNKHRGDLDMVRQEHWTGCEDPGHDDCAIAQVTSPEVAAVRLGHPEYDAKPNAEFIAHARSDVPWLLERIDEQEQGLWAAAGEVDKLQNRVVELERENEKLAQGKRDAEAYARLMLGR